MGPVFADKPGKRVISIWVYVCRCTSVKKCHLQVCHYEKKQPLSCMGPPRIFQTFGDLTRGGQVLCSFLVPFWPLGLMSKGDPHVVRVWVARSGGTWRVRFEMGRGDLCGAAGSWGQGVNAILGSGFGSQEGLPCQMSCSRGISDNS